MKSVTEVQFDQAKKLIAEKGHFKHWIGKKVGVSAATISKINGVATFADYSKKYQPLNGFRGTYKKLYLEKRLIALEDRVKILEDCFK